jgi:class 3 adenylate cyclase
MSKFEWMELETLSNEIAHSQSRLDAARNTKNLGLAQLLEREIADAMKKRAQVLADITKGLDHSAGRKPKLLTAPVRQAEPESLKHQQPAEEVQPTVNATTEPALSLNTEKGVARMWEKITAADIERVKRGLATRRAEILARHAEELKGLEADQNEIEVFEKAIAAFAQKFNPTRSAEVLVLDTERVPA